MMVTEHKIAMQQHSAELCQSTNFYSKPTELLITSGFKSLEFQLI